MPDQPQGSQPAAAPQAPDVAKLDLSKFFGPAAGADVPAAEAAPEVAPAEAVTPSPPPVPDPVPEVKNELAEALNEWRAEKKTAEVAKTEAQSWRGKYEALQGELETVKSAPAFHDDPLGYARAHNWTKEQQTEIVQLLAYDLAPDRAPTDFRFKVFESRQQAEKAREKSEREAHAARQAEMQQVQSVQTYVASLDAAISTFPAGAYAANEDWYGENRQAYLADLFTVANELAEEATAKGERAALDAATLAAKLEQRSATKLAALEQRRSKRKPPGVKPADVAVQSDNGPANTQGLNTGGPRPPAQTEDERIRRATEVAFGGR
jgi:hypothetical protein